MECRGGTRDKNFKLKECSFRLDIGEKFFAMMVVGRWTRLPRGAVDAPSLEGLKARLDETWSKLVWWKMSLPMAGGELDDLWGPFQPKPFRDTSLVWEHMCAAQFWHNLSPSPGER